jgi:hypothetical protein
MVDTAALLTAYDAQMRMPPGPVPDGATYEHEGPVLRVVGGDVGRIRAPRDVVVTGAELDRLIAPQRDYFQARGQGVEWKLRAHDRPADLPERLVAAGFVPQEPSAVLLGFAEEVAAEGGVSPGQRLRRAARGSDAGGVAGTRTLSRHAGRPGPGGRRPRLPAAARRRVSGQRAHPAPVRLSRDHHSHVVPLDPAEIAPFEPPASSCW